MHVCWAARFPAEEENEDEAKRVKKKRLEGFARALRVAAVAARWSGKRRGADVPPICMPSQDSS
eukprot:CAMPEP_0206589672 /NCGR_PEP_ID=MMETSP0325_2-20121206/39078_1 /ASSEMBLY_ACC=CAM_ASM_000347 /TAXON_ID=2866 /ORGANISM="Crypthecodinium cohnii, Strain Seligo" /LENGTH=63 /DNA_ID=CAMNT_0054098307 /DNA_START=156 /DNA_END=344 /DNA_ORIENTATION=+